MSLSVTTPFLPSNSVIISYYRLLDGHKWSYGAKKAVVTLEKHCTTASNEPKDLWTILITFQIICYRDLLKGLNIGEKLHKRFKIFF